jgi:CubicO group peptidase (beta-lactamase class C family)
VTRDGRTVFAKAYGLADRARKIPNTLETRFDVGSMNKMMTAVAIAQLADAGRISLGATVGRYLPDYSNATVRDKVTIAHLLSHTSGLGSYWKRPIRA